MSKITPEQANKLLMKLGYGCFNSGIKIIRSAFRLKPKVYTRSQIRNLLQSYGLKSVSLSDEKYYVTSWDVVGKIIDYDLIDEMIYRYDTRDCDNYSFAFASRASVLYNLNSFGVCYGRIYSKKTGKLLGRHAFNLIITEDNGILHPRLYEAQNDGDCLLRKKTGNYNPKNLIKDWFYDIDWVIFF